MSKSPYRADNSCAAGTDTVFLKKLQLKNGVDAPDIWGSEKNQPAVASIHLILRDGFGSAASIDALDHNTIHYGQLAKHVQSKCSKVAKLQEVFDAIKSEIVGMARRADGSSKVAYTAIELTLPKASMYGEGVGIISTLKLDGNGHLSLLQRNFVLMDLKIMVLIGVNDNERTKKQPVMVNLDMTLREAHESLLEAHNGILFAVESKLVKVRSLSVLYFIVIRPLKFRRSSKTPLLKRWRRWRSSLLTNFWSSFVIPICLAH